MPYDRKKFPVNEIDATAFPLAETFDQFFVGVIVFHLEDFVG
jgi:hypothetical protein